MIQLVQTTLARWRDGVFLRIILLAGLLGAIWLISSPDLLFGLHLSRYGVHPRRIADLPHILTAPWIHADLGHLLSNTIGLLILGWLTLWPRKSDFVLVVFASIVGGGLCAWLLGSPYSVHFGASGIVFGFAGFLLARCRFSFSLFSLLTASIVLSLYGLNLLIGVLPLQAGISWQSHLGGALGGIAVAWLQGGQR